MEFCTSENPLLHLEEDPQLTRNMVNNKDAVMIFRDFMFSIVFYLLNENLINLLFMTNISILGQNTEKIKIRK